MKATKKFRQLAAFFMAVIVVLSGFSIPVNAAGEGKALNTLTFNVKGENGKPIGIEMDVFDKYGSALDQNIRSNESGVATWSPEDWFNNYYAQQELTIAPSKNGNYVSDNPIRVVVGTGGIATVNGIPAEQVTDVTITVRERGEADNTTTLYLYVKDEVGKPLEGISFLCPQAWGDPKEQTTDAQGLLKYVMPQYVYSEISIEMKNSELYEKMDSVVLESDGNGNITSVNGKPVASGNDLKLEITLVAKGEGPIEPNVDTTKLEETIQKAKSYDKEDYTIASWNELQKVIAVAEALLADPKMTQEKVEKQITVLEEAIENLEPNSQETDMLTFTLVVKDENGQPVEGVKYTGETNWASPYSLETNAEGKIVTKFNGYEAITYKLTDERYKTTSGNIYVRANGTQITEVAGKPVASAEDLVFEVVVEKIVEEPEFDNTKFTVRVVDENGQPVEGLKLRLKSPSGPYADISFTNLTDADGKVSYIGDTYEYGTYELHPTEDSEYICINPIEIAYAQDSDYNAYIDTVDGEKYIGQELNLVVKKAGDRKTLIINVKDEKGNPVDDCEFVVANDAFPNVENASDLVKPENGVLKVQLKDKVQSGGEVRLSKEAKESYTSEPEKIVFKSSQGVFTTVNGELYDGATEFEMVVTELGGEPEEPEVDTSKLEKAIVEAEAIEKGNYTDDSWNVLQNAIKAAKVILEDKDATQTQVDEQVTALENAIKALKTKPESGKPDPENPDKPNTGKPGDDSGNGGGTVKPDSTGKPNAGSDAAPKTGDTAQPFVYMAGMIFAIVVLLGVLRRKKALK